MEFSHDTKRKQLVMEELPTAREGTRWADNVPEKLRDAVDPISGPITLRRTVRPASRLRFRPAVRRVALLRSERANHQAAGAVSLRLESHG